MILLDTDVVSFILKGDNLGERYFGRVKGQRLYVSFMTAAELYQWAEVSHWGERRKHELETLLTQRYAVLGFELGLVKEWAQIRAECRRSGTPISVQDGFVAATARYFDLPLLSHNRKHFKGVMGISLLTVETGE